MRAIFTEYITTLYCYPMHLYPRWRDGGILGGIDALLLSYAPLLPVGGWGYFGGYRRVTVILCTVTSVGMMRVFLEALKPISWTFVRFLV